MATVNVTDENFEAEVIKAGKPVIVDFWAEWCGPCKQIGPILEEISNEMSDVEIAKHNIDNEPNTPTKYGIRGIPTMLLFSGGELKEKISNLNFTLKISNSIDSAIRSNSKDMNAITLVCGSLYLIGEVLNLN